MFNASGGRESAPGGTPSRRGQREDPAAGLGLARLGSVRLRGARSGRPPFVRLGSGGAIRAAALRSAPAAAPPPPAPPPAQSPAPVQPAAATPAPSPARPPGRCRYLCPLAAVLARRCAPAARPTERCGATNSAEREETTKRPTALSPAPGPWLCSSAATSPPGLGRRTRSARLLGRLVSAAGSCWRRKPKAASLGRCLGDRHLSALLCPLPKEQPPAPASPTHSWRTKYGRGPRSAGETSRAAFCAALGFIAPRADAFLLQAQGWVDLLPASTLALLERGYSSTQARQAVSYNPAEDVVRSSALQNTLHCMGQTSGGKKKRFWAICGSQSPADLTLGTAEMDQRRRLSHIQDLPPPQPQPEVTPLEPITYA
ncbi:uncharacterized protein VSU04_008443 [Chlamydotis macqueenii]